MDKVKFPNDYLSLFSTDDKTNFSDKKENLKEISEDELLSNNLIRLIKG
jgi:hypothetical protein